MQLTTKNIFLWVCQADTRSTNGRLPHGKQTLISAGKITLAFSAKCRNLLQKVFTILHLDLKGGQ